jgi:putative ABC transport system substrate-binding protein
VDLILTIGTPATLAAKQATLTIPIVFNLADDPVANGLVASFNRPGGNVTGFTWGTYHEKRLQVLREAVPHVSRVAMFYGRSAEGLSEVAQALGMTPHLLQTRSPDDLDGAFKAAMSARDDAILVGDVAWYGAHLRRVVDGVVKSRLPAIGPYRNFAVLGGLLSYGATPRQDVPVNADYIDQILKGAKPADLPVQRPSRFQLVVNLKTAKALGLTIPPSVLARADEVIQ